MLTRESLFAALIMAIIAESAFIGIVNYAYVYNALPDFSGATMPGQVAINQHITQSASVIGGQNYTSTNGFETNITIQTGDWVIIPGSGYRLASDSILPFGNDPVLSLKNTQGINNVYTATYTISTSPSGTDDFYIFVRTEDPGSWSDNDIKLVFTANQINAYFGEFYERSIFPYTPFQSSAYPNANKLTDITTVLDENNHVLTVFAGSSEIMYIQIPTIVNPPGSYSDRLRYAGIGSHSVGFTVRSIAIQIMDLTQEQMNAGDFAESDYLRLLHSILGGYFPWLINIMETIAVCTGFTAGAMIPGWIGLIWITPQVVTLIYIGAELIGDFIP